MFSAADTLPKGSLTVSFKFRLFGRRLAGLGCIGIKAANLLSFATTASGNTVYLDFDNEALDIPAPGGYSTGWHQLLVAFDSATGILQAYFDGQLGVNRTEFKQGKSLAGTFGPGSCLLGSQLPFWQLPGSDRLIRWHRVVCGLSLQLYYA